MNDVRMGVLGCAGRMGRALLHEIFTTEGATISGGIERPGHETIGRDLGAQAGLGGLDIAVGEDLRALMAASDVVLDFTAPIVTVAAAALAAETGTALVAGTTGIEAGDEARITAAGEKTVIVRAANFCVGVNLLQQLTRQVAAVLDPDFDIEVVEIHHRHKVDAPSGTALALGIAAAEGRGVVHDEVTERGRDGITGARARGAIGYASLRGGNVAGEHSVIFAADNERIELTHKAGDRSIFARGGVRAALWCRGRAPGRYSMLDVLGFGDT